MKFTQNRLIMLTALFLVASGNITFFSKLLSIYPVTGANLGLILSLPLILWSILVIFMAVLCYRWTCRPVLSVFIILSATAAYVTDNFGTVIDDVMILNMLETNVSEVTDLVNPGFLLRVTLLGLLPALVVWWIPVTYSSGMSEFYAKLRLIFVSLAVSVASIFLFSSHYASFAREHKPLRYFINPTYPLYSAIKYITKRPVNEHSVIAPIGSDALIPESDTHKELVILVVGETARADHFSLNGYARKTNPLLEKEQRLFSYADIDACGTSTAISVPCMFSNLGHDGYDHDQAMARENVLDVLNKSGVSVLWRDNNSDSKGVALRVEYEDYKTAPTNTICDTECRDEGMLVGLQEYVDKQPGDVLIVLHQMGNHGPAYYKRYPESFESFSPSCKSAELSACTQDEIVNAYDNAILYTDYFLSKVVSLLKSNSVEYETVMLYVSDHGESLGEHGVYLHGMPYSIAPDQQIKVPVILWLGESTDADYATIKNRVATHNSHDAVFHTLLNIFEIESRVLDKKKALYESAD